MEKMLQRSSSEMAEPLPPLEMPAAPLPQVLWRRRWIVLGAMVASLGLAGLYLIFATRVYSATARVEVEQNGPRALGESREGNAESEGMLQTQVELLQSVPVLRRAFTSAVARIPHIAAAAAGDPVDWLREGHGLRVELGKKSDVVLVTMESQYPQEAVALADSLVDAYIAEQTERGQATSDNMLAILKKEKADKEQQRDQLIVAMQKYRRENGILELQDSKGNTILDRASTLSTSLTSTEMSVMELKAELAATQVALSDPASTAAFVEAQQQKNKDSGDQELNDLRNERIQYELALNSSQVVQGGKSQHVQILNAVLDAINAGIVAKEQSMGRAMLASVKARLAAAQQQEVDLHAALKAQTDTALNLSPETYANAQADVARLQKALDVLDNRITELNVNKTTQAGPLDISIMERAVLEDHPVKPNVLMVLGAAMLLGCVGGMGIAIGCESLDARLRSPDDVRSQLRVRVVASVPPITGEMSAVARGQIVRLDARSVVAEAYRSVRTALHLGSNLVGRTLLFVSPSTGEGKSTTASNVALAFAQAGERTLLIDCDMREPVQHLIFEVDASIGLSDVLCGSARLRDAVRTTEMPGLFVLPCGPVPTNPSELLASKRFVRLMQALGKTFDRIIIDAPPLMNVTDGYILAAAADVTLLVLRMNQSTREPAVLVLDDLDRVGANVLGIVANGVPAPRSYRYYGAASNYATHANRRLSFGATALGDQSPADAFPANGRRASASDEEILIEEPEWAAD
jgi:capsular exopolysaccharide synthesis family protein